MDIGSQATLGVARPWKVLVAIWGKKSRVRGPPPPRYCWGVGQLVYPIDCQVTALLRTYVRHLWEGGRGQLADTEGAAGV